MPTIKELQVRVAALQQRLKPEVSVADRLKKARERWRVLTPEQQQARRDARLAEPEPPIGTMRHRLWLAARRVAALRDSHLHG